MSTVSAIDRPPASGGDVLAVRLPIADDEVRTRLLELRADAERRTRWQLLGLELTTIRGRGYLLDDTTGVR